MLLSVPPTEDLMYGCCVLGWTQLVRRPSILSESWRGLVMSCEGERRMELPLGASREGRPP